MGATAAIAAAVVGAAGSAYSANRQARAVESASRDAADRADPAAGLRPYFQNLLMGGKLDDLMSFDPNAIRNSPEYRFRMDEGLGTIDSAAARDGLLRSGRRDADRISFAEGLASTMTNEDFVRRMGMLDRLFAAGGITTGSPAAAGQLLLSGQGMAGAANANMWGQIGAGMNFLQRQNWGNLFQGGNSGYSPWNVTNTGSASTEPPPDGGWAGA